MSALAFVAPGQGLSRDDLVASLTRHHDHPLVRRFAAHGGADLATFDFTDPAVLQPATLAATVAEAAGVPVERFAFVLGHSLGEISALTIAGAFEPDAAFELVVRRAELCGREAAAWPGRMVAVLGLDQAAVEYARRLATRRSGEPLDLACVNSATQFVVSGPDLAIKAFGNLVTDEGGLFQPLPIPGAYHSVAMAGAVDEFAAAVRAATPRAPRVPLLSAIDGHRHDDAAGLDRVLSRALVNPVLWRDAVLAAHRHGITAMVELGPGRTLTKLARYDRILPFTRSMPCS